MCGSGLAELRSYSAIALPRSNRQFQEIIHGILYFSLLYCLEVLNLGFQPLLPLEYSHQRKIGSSEKRSQHVDPLGMAFRLGTIDCWPPAGQYRLAIE
jgi:hypothetical protein